MGMGFNIMQMGICIKENILMDWLKAMGNMHGLMVALLKEILNRVIEMDMDYGNQKVENNNIKVITY